jgi:methylated-DNA-protein-cysteine methyltransferase-like protein
MAEAPDQPAPLYTRIYAVVRQIPPGKIASYGQIAEVVGGCSARMVGYAMSALKEGMDVPWQRVINSMGKLSVFGDFGNHLQRQLLEEEGVRFDAQGRIDFEIYGWLGSPHAHPTPQGSPRRRKPGAS